MFEILFLTGLFIIAIILTVVIRKEVVLWHDKQLYPND